MNLLEGVTAERVHQIREETGESMMQIKDRLVRKNIYEALIESKVPVEEMTWRIRDVLLHLLREEKL